MAADLETLVGVKTHTINHGGKSLTLVPGGRFGISGQFCKWIKDRRRAELEETLKGKPAAIQVDTLLAFNRVVNLECGYRGTSFIDALNTAEGRAEFIRLMAKEHHPTLTIAEVSDLVMDETAEDEILEALRVLCPKIFPRPEENVKLVICPHCKKTCKETELTSPENSDPNGQPAPEAPPT